MKRIGKIIMSLIVLVSLAFVFVKVKNICHNQRSNDYAANYVIKNEEKLEDSESIGFETEVIIVVGAVLVSGGLGFVLYWFIYKKKSNKNKE